MSDDQYAAFLEQMAEVPTDVWRDTDGTIYSRFMPASMAPPVGGPVDSSVGLAPDDPKYAAFASDLLPWFDYQGMEVPNGQNPDGNAQPG